MKMEKVIPILYSANVADSLAYYMAVLGFKVNGDGKTRRPLAVFAKIQ